MAVAVIPARWSSSRLPGKPLEILAGKSMIEHVYRRSLMARGIERVIVATDHDGIAEVVRKFGGEVAMTGECRTGTDRVAQVAKNLDCDLVVNVQGDEPLIPHLMIEEVLAPFKEDNFLEMASLKRSFRPDEDSMVPHAVKVVTDVNDYALYFSRSLIPFPNFGDTILNSRELRSCPQNFQAVGPFLHVGIYAYRKDFLLQFAALPCTPLEITEGLEQLRALEHGHRIRVPTTEHFSIGVDTPEDLARVRKLMM